jgi:phosphatidylglycerophosphatase A
MSPGRGPGATPGPSGRLGADRIAIGIATAGGAGYVPLAPGTAGALVGVGIYVLIQTLGLNLFYVPILAVLTIAGVWAATRVEFIYGHDASRIVIDEVVGQMLALGFVLRSGPRALTVGVVLGFLLFRVFDILKPFPIRRLENLPGGVGVVADDLAAGLYAHVVLRLIESGVGVAGGL